jgi:riboflavin biosynthesis pyrimidine reductase
MLEISTLYDGADIPSSPYLTNVLHEAYDGDLFFRNSSKRPLVFCNFVQTLDGIVSLKIPGKSGGAEISGTNQEDTFVMGVLRACADAVMIGEDTFRNAPGHVWTAGRVYPPFIDEFQTFRKQIGKVSLHPMNVVVSGIGHIDLDQPLFRHPEISSLVLTTQQGAARLQQRYGATLPATVRVLPGDDVLDPSEMMDLLQVEYGIERLLHEGGPTLLASFLEHSWLDEIFLTVSPQMVGRGPTGERPSFSGPLGLTPEQAIWTTLLSVKRAVKSGHLFLRYRLRPKGNGRTP